MRDSAARAYAWRIAQSATTAVVVFRGPPRRASQPPAAPRGVSERWCAASRRGPLLGRSLPHG